MSDNIDVNDSFTDEIENTIPSIRSNENASLADQPRPDGNGWLDQVQQKVVSRKLLVFGTATALLIWAGLDANTWGMIAMCYIGGQSAIDFAKVWRG